MIRTCLRLIALMLVVITVSACRPEAASPKVKEFDREAAVETIEITVYKSPTCGCCKNWVAYLQEEGYQVTSVDTDDVDTIKSEFGLTDPSLKSCHTAIVDEYIIEGHVPVSDIQRLLTERPKNIKGLTAPGMPMMSPGMASREPKDYAVLSFTDSGDSQIYSQY